jgi:hypothetical protein
VKACVEELGNKVKCAFNVGGIASVETWQPTTVLAALLEWLTWSTAFSHSRTSAMWASGIELLVYMSTWVPS